MQGGDGGGDDAADASAKGEQEGAPGNGGECVIKFETQEVKGKFGSTSKKFIPKCPAKVSDGSCEAAQDLASCDRDCCEWQTDEAKGRVKFERDVRQYEEEGDVPSPEDIRRDKDYEKTWAYKIDRGQDDKKHTTMRLDQKKWRKTGQKELKQISTKQLTRPFVWQEMLDNEFAKVGDSTAAKCWTTNLRR